jgi:hypothetical protein
MFKLTTMRLLRPGRAFLIAGLAMFLGVAGHLSAQSPAGPEAGEDIRGPKALVEIPQPKKPPVALWLGTGGGIVLLAMAALLWRRYSRKRRLKSPTEIALISLRELAARREAIPAEAFANLAAMTVRQYIAERFGLAAPRRTSEEFLRDLAHEEGSPLRGESDHLRVFLKSCDLAKFAGTRLDASQREEMIQSAREFIHATAAPISNSKSKVVAP